MPSVAIIGASNDPSRISHRAVLRYLDLGWTVWPIHPTAATICEQRAWPRLADLPGAPDIACMYVRPDIGLTMVADLARLSPPPRAVWLNPGSESPALIAALAAANLRSIEACTLVVLAHSDPLLWIDRR